MGNKIPQYIAQIIDSWGFGVSPRPEKYQSATQEFRGGNTLFDNQGSLIHNESLFARQDGEKS